MNILLKLSRKQLRDSMISGLVITVNGETVSGYEVQDVSDKIAFDSIDIGQEFIVKGREYIKVIPRGDWNCRLLNTVDDNEGYLQIMRIDTSVELINHKSDEPPAKHEYT